jgi:hypothetical protein
LQEKLAIITGRLAIIARRLGREQSGVKIERHPQTADKQ